MYMEQKIIRSAKTIRLISLAFLCVAASSGPALHRGPIHRAAPGPVRVQAASGPFKGETQQTWKRQQQTPMVKDVPTSPIVPVKTHLHHDLKQYRSGALRVHDQLLLVSDFYFSSLSDRAPPLS
jgi:hypothetical protein